MRSSIDYKSWIPRCNKNVPVSASWEPLVQIDFWIISIVEQDQPFISIAAEPLEGILGSDANTLRCRYSLESCFNRFNRASVDEEDIREARNKVRNCP